MDLTTNVTLRSVKLTASQHTPNLLFVVFLGVGVISYPNHTPVNPFVGDSQAGLGCLGYDGGESRAQATTTKEGYPHLATLWFECETYRPDFLIKTG